MTEKRKRVTLTAVQLQESAGVELLSLCRSVADDGVLSDEEITELRDWLNRNNTTDLPALQFLQSLVNRILEDAVVTDEERTELQVGIERVLPKDIRDLVSKTRKEKAGIERARNKRLETYDFMVAGAHLKKYAEEIEYLSEDDQIFFECEPDNRHDRHAVKVLSGRNSHLGYVPRDAAGDFSALLNEGNRYRGYVKKIIGYNRKIPVVVAEFYGRDATVEGTRNAQDPIPVAPGCGSAMVVGVLALGLLVRFLA